MASSTGIWPSGVRAIHSRSSLYGAKKGSATAKGKGVRSDEKFIEKEVAKTLETMKLMQS